METESYFPDTIQKGSDTLFVKLTKQLQKASLGLDSRMEKEPNQSESNTRWQMYKKNRKKLDFWLNQLPVAVKASDFELPPPPKE